MVKLYSLPPQDAVLLSHTPQGRRYRYGSDRDDARHIAVWGGLEATEAADRLAPQHDDDNDTSCQRGSKSVTTAVTRPVSR